LTLDPRSIEKSQEAIRLHGTGTTGSRVANGTYAVHKQFEEILADFLGFKQCIIFVSGYQANLGAISGLIDSKDTILVDADCHASIYDGCRLSGATTIRFRHNSPKDLDRRLARLKSPGGSCLVIVEGMYSMYGDIAPIAELLAVAKSHGAYLYVDEAHSFGTFGPKGRGVSEAQGVLDQIDFYAGTFSKSLGSTGGFCCSSHEEFKLLSIASRPYVFTASPSPSSIASAKAILERMRSVPELRDKLWENARQLHAALMASAYELCAPVSLNIVCLRFVAPSKSEAELADINREIVMALQESGIAAPSTTTLRGRLAIRVNITNHRSRYEDFDVLTDAIVDSGRGLLSA
jgi:8-amino-7-oxononanoate synthase